MIQAGRLFTLYKLQSLEHSFVSAYEAGQAGHSPGVCGSLLFPFPAAHPYRMLFLGAGCLCIPSFSGWVTWHLQDPYSATSSFTCF